MNTRERILAIGVLAILVIVGGFFLVQAVFLGPLQKKSESIAILADQIDKKTARVEEIQAELPKLERLEMGHTRITDKGIESLAAIQSLQVLKLDYTPVTDKALELLKQLPNLKELSLDHTNVTDRGVEVLRSITTLQSLDLYHTTVSKNGYETLRTSLPQCRIFYDEQSGFPSRRGI